MSIFKSTLDPAIAAQLKAREAVVSNEGSRGDTFLRYTSGKNSWVRMTSFVNYDDPKGRYKGDQLSKKYILEGGTLYNTGGENYNLRSGVGKIDGVYASNLDFNNASGKSDLKKGLGIDRPYGLRPMPGITSANIINKSAYGSLREATIQFYAWDKHQLEELEILFMRPGYTVFFEWGWSQYLDHGVANNVNSIPNNINIKNFDIATLNPFQSSPALDDNSIYQKIDKDIEKAKGNYDAMLGYVQNFSWQLMSNGGFQCSTTLISRGEVISGIKSSNNPNIILDSVYKVQTSAELNSDEPKPILSTFEKIFLNIIASANESEFVKSFGFGAGSITSTTGSLYISGSTTDQQKALRDQSDSIVGEISTRLTKAIFKEVKGSWDNYTIDKTTGIDLNKNVVIKFCNGQTEGTAIEYISMNAFIAIINEFFLIKNKNTNEQVINIAIPNNTPCLTSEDSISIDPTTCIIKNSYATFITADLTNGFNPQLFSVVNASSLSSDGTSTTTTIPEFIINDSSKKHNIGAIGNIYVSINKIIQIYRSLSGGPDGVDIIDLMQEILDACSFALGGINDFKLYSNKNIAQVIDVKYFENSKPEDKFKFDLIGLKSICRDVKINSRIFSEQSTMIAIGATSGNNANIGDVYSSTQNYFNKGLTDRILTTVYGDNPDDQKISVGGTELSGSAAYYFNIYRNIESLSHYVNRNVLGVSEGDYKVTRLPQDNEVKNAGSLLKTFHYQINGKDVDFKALIPFELEITLDGISGFVVGQIFVIDKSILPKDYYNKNLGFIITGLSHNLQNNDWVTVVKTQICLLENDIIPSYGVDKDLLRKTITQIQSEVQKATYLLCALADYMVNQTIYYGLITKTSGGSLSFVNSLNLLSNQQIIEENISGDGTKPPKDWESKDSRLKKFVDNVVVDSEIDAFLQSWFDQAKTLNLPGFPATLKELKETNIPGQGPVTWTSTRFVEFINGATIGAKSDADQLTKGQIIKQKTTSNGVTIGYTDKEAAKAFKNIWDNTFVGKVIGTNNFITIPTSTVTNTNPTKGSFTTFGTDNKYNNNVLIEGTNSQPIYSRSGNAIIGWKEENVAKDGFKDMWFRYYNYLKTNAGICGTTSFAAAATTSQTVYFVNAN